jgi:hypothetical protein
MLGCGLVIRCIVPICVGGRGTQSTDATRRYSPPALLSITYLALAEHTLPGRHLASYDMVIAPALSVHVILAFAALAFVGAVLLGAF